MDEEITGTYLRMPNINDIKKVTDLRKLVHGVQGMLMSIDCLHVFWKNCPVSQQCYFKNGKTR